MACACKNKKNSAPKLQVKKTTIASNGKATSSKKVMRRDIK